MVDLKSKLTVLLLGVLTTSIVNAQDLQQPTPRASTASAVHDSQRLPITNPLFVPYARQWFVGLSAVEQRSVFSTRMPAQMIGSVNFPESSLKTSDISIRTGGIVGYGITDRLALSIATTYFADTQRQITASGSFTPPVNQDTSPGFYNPYFSAMYRLLGIHREEWHLNVQAQFSPGNVGRRGNPASDYEAGIMVGRTFLWFTAALAGSLDYSPEATLGNTTYKSSTAVSGEMMLQANFHPIFLNLYTGIFKYVDSNSGSDAFSNMTRWFCQAQIGGELTADTYVKVSYGWMLPVSVETRMSGILVQMEDRGGPVAALELGIRF